MYDHVTWIFEIVQYDSIKPVTNVSLFSDNHLFLTRRRTNTTAATTIKDTHDTYRVLFLLAVFYIKAISLNEKLVELFRDHSVALSLHNVYGHMHAHRHT